MSQKGRSIKSVGQGSKGAGASGYRGLGDPVLVGEWKKSSNKESPAAFVSDRSRNEAARGVGNAGTDGAFKDPKGLLPGVPGDTSEFSSRWVKDILRLFILLRLEDEKLFLNLRAVGEPVISSSPFSEPSWPNGDAAGRTAVVSVGLASNNGGEGCL